ncbi:acyl-CoA carboxylase epsilon subunit [Streptomyces sp. NPDC003077]|uniref:acyl-CoA carboxylase epsilon subunit n=1 Tax=Streptomyces sp. NPDC003077 TaxID=3154443 RepID=UPI0033AEE464
MRVVRGNPTPEELAAALAVVRARAAAGTAVAPGPERTDEWASPAAAVAARRMPRPAPGAWRTSFWPR